MRGSSSNHARTGSRYLAAALAVALGSTLAACSAGDDDDEGQAQTSPEPAATLVLSPAGLGVADFGDDKAVAEAALTDVLGPSDAEGPGGASTWGDRALHVGWFDAEDPGSEGGEFSAWEYSGPVDAAVLATAEGVTVGSSVDTVRDAYPDATVRLDACLDKWVFELGEGPELPYPSVELDEPAVPRPTEMIAVLDGDPDDPSSTVENLHAGVWLC